jgi:hypothetical protein
MNRRSFVQYFTGAATAGLLPVGNVDVIPSDVKPALIVLTVDARIALTEDEALKAAQRLKSYLSDTPLSGVKVLVLPDYLRLTCIDANGRILTNERIDLQTAADPNLTSRS